MSVPGFPSVMSFYLMYGEKEAVLTYVCTWLPLLAVISLSFSRDGQEGVLDKCPYLPFS